MATFAKKAFNASAYSSFRPTYPKKLFKEIFDYHRAGNGLWDVAADLGCGTGQATTELKGHFATVIGIDPSQPMIDAAQKKHKYGGLAFRQGRSEDLSNVLPSESVDLLISAQAGHWFNWELVWPEVSRVLRKDGTAAFWTYAEFRLSEFPSATPLITAYSQGKDPATSLGLYWERPGRTILENMLTDVPDPTSMETVMKRRGGLAHFERRYFAGPHFPAHLPSPSPTQIKRVEMRVNIRWRDLLGYFRTWSSLYNFHERFPEDLDKVDERFPEDKLAAPAGQDSVKDVSSDRIDVDVSGGDIAVRFWKDLREEVKRQGGKYGVDEIVSVEWPIALLLAKKV
ncbi:putative methyltransferase domain containing protein [Lyophyllum shimeji]|uniref:Methyltransferase domain containing protein n=1 Tax=Lyophyllum shimeji TaxID=47721 RepID=A0A9P3UPN0_LYOSH|nr:putative methyltransferase domain containing protein [Lyophyllum shimeji]